MSTSIIIPLFNEGKRFKEENFKELLDKEEVNLLFVDDGSSDDTAHIIQELVTKRRNVAFLSQAKNLGKGEAIRAGFQRVLRTNVDLICFLDGDGAFDSKEVFNIIKKLEHLETCKDISNCKIFFSSRIKLSGSQITRSKRRHYFNRVLITLLFHKLDYFPYDTQSGFKIFRNCEHTKKLFENQFETKWLFDIELIIRDFKIHNSFRIEEIPIKYWREIGNSKLNYKSLFKIIKEINRIRYLLAIMPTKISLEPKNAKN